MKLGLIIALSIIGLCIYVTLYVLSVPNYNQTIISSRDVKIHRDSYGIPHILAESFNDATFGLGFAHAQDRLWQLQIRRLASYGNLSSVLGDATFEMDQYIRNIGYMESVYLSSEKIDVKQRELLQAYADGVNEGVKSLTMLPIEFQITQSKFEPWTVIDSIVFTKFQSFMLSVDFLQEVLRSKINEIYDTETASILTGVGSRNQYDNEMTIINNEELKQSDLYSEERIQQAQWQTGKLNKIKDLQLESLLPPVSGSNAWAIHGNHTTTGYSMLAGDPHLENAIPGQWYSADLQFGDNYLIGATMPGIPGVFCGKSKYLTWSSTVLYSDTVDLYEEQVKLIDGKLHYLFKDEWKPTKEKVEVYNVKGCEERRTIHFTGHGPIILAQLSKRTKQFEKFTNPVSLRSLIHEGDAYSSFYFIEALLQKSLTDTFKLFERVVYPHLAMVFASQKDIGYMSVGHLVKRSGHPEQHAFIKQGWLGEVEWLETTHHPYFINPPKGYFISANNKIYAENDKYHQSVNVLPTARARRIEDQIQILLSKGKISMESMKILQRDVIDAYCEKGLPHLWQYINKQSEKQLKFQEILSNWNCQFTQDSTKATLYTFFESYFSSTFKDLDSSWGKTYLFDTFYFKEIQNMNPNAKWCQNFNQSSQPCLDNLHSSIEKAIDNFNKLQDKRWGTIHPQYFPHTFRGKLFGFFDRQIPYQGNRRTIHVSWPSLQDDQYEGTAGANYQQLVSMRPGDQSYFIMDTGISGNVFSKHYDDQMKLWAKGEYLPMGFDINASTHLTKISKELKKIDL